MIKGLKGEGGSVQTGREEMMETATKFYQELFRRREVDGEVGEEFLGYMEAAVPPGIREELERDWSLEEMGEALRGMKPNKVPGMDGLPAEFYSVVWEGLGPDLLEVFGEVIEEGRMGDSMREGVISLLHKKGEEEDLRNWRPITLLGVDYKLMARVLAARIIVAPDQTCGVVGRQLFWNLLLVQDAISCSRDRGLPMMLVGLDQEKAFDRVSHKFLFRVLVRLGFGPRFVKWVRVLYAGVGSRVNLNGHLSAFVLQEAGVRQGCPMSPLLYVLYMEPFAGAGGELVHGPSGPVQGTGGTGRWDRRTAGGRGSVEGYTNAGARKQGQGSELAVSPPAATGEGGAVSALPHTEQVLSM